VPAAPDDRRTADTAPPPSIGEVVDYVKIYAQQETIAPLKGAGRWIGFGIAGALLLGGGLMIVLLGLLRLVQTEWDRAATGSLSWLAYVIVLAVCIVLIALVVSRIKQEQLTKEHK
jgi:hypothetical protein